MNEPIYEVVWPLAKSTYEMVPPARRTTDLSGKTVCQMWNWGFKGDQIFSVLRELLAKRFPGIQFVDYAVFGKIDGTPESEAFASNLIRERRCDLVISGIGG